MRRKLIFTILTMFIFSLSVSFAVEAAQVPWSTEYYYVYAGAEFKNFILYDFSYDNAVGPPLPISARAGVYYDEWDFATAGVEFTDTTINLSFSAAGHGVSRGEASFSGNYTAIDPYFVFSYDLSPYIGLPILYIGIQDLTTSTTLYQSNIQSGSDVLYIPTTVGNEIDVDLKFGVYDLGRRNYTKTLTYSMSSSAVVPEPVSMVLFVIGGVLLTGRRFIRMNERGHR